MAGGSDADRVVRAIPAATDGLVEAVSDQLRRDLLQQAEQLVRPRIKNPNNWQAYLRRKQGEPARQIGVDLDMAVAAVHKARSRVMEMIREEIARLLGEE